MQDGKLEMIKHLNYQEDHRSNKNQDRETRNDQSSASLPPVSPSGPARAFGKQIFGVARVLEDVWRIEWTPSRRCPCDPFLTLTLLFFLCQTRCFFDLALQFFHLPTQLLLLFGEFVFFR